MKKLVLLIAVGVTFGVVVWFGLRSKSATGGREAMVPTAAATDSLTPESTSRTPRVFRHRDRLSPKPAADVMDVWDKQIDALLASDGTDAEIADKLLELYPHMPTEGQADLILEIAPRIANDSYSNKLSVILTNATAPEEVLETLLTDLIDRPDTIRLPRLLDMARSKDNPKSGDAHDLLEALLGDDYGDDWDQWSKKISEWIASHPE